MIITRLYIRNFRNIREAELNFDDRLNVFVGKNAQGKTNLMEAISVCLGAEASDMCVFRSIFRFRTAVRKCLSGCASAMMTIPGVKILWNIRSVITSRR